MADQAGPSGSLQPQSAEMLSTGDALFQEGITAIKAGEYEKAVAAFADVLQIRAKHYGQLAEECASAYYRYGSALLYQAQESADVFGGPIRGEGEDGDKENEAAAEKEEEAEEEAEPAAVAAPAANDKGKGPAEEPVEEAPAVAEEDVCDGGDLQLAWENLETARTIWNKTPEKHLAELAEVHSQLADVNMENEAFEDSLADIEAALEYRSKLDSDPINRIVADLQFRRCLVLQFLDKNKESLQSVKDAISTLEQCKAKLAHDATADKDDADKEKAAKDIEDITAALEDLKDKVEELQEVIKEEEATKNAVRGAMVQIAAAANQGNGNAATSAGPSPIKDLGVVGRGTKRINLAPVSAPAGASGATTTEPAAKKSRALEDLMGGGPGGETSVGFGATATATEEKKEEAPSAAVPAFLQAANVAKVYTADDNKSAAE